MMMHCYSSNSTPYILDKSGMSALHIAAFVGHIEVMKEDIQSRPDTCERLTANDQTILHVAVLGAQSIVVEYIVKIPELRILRDQVDKRGNTPLHVAINATIDKEFSLLFNNFLGDNIEVQEIIDTAQVYFKPA
ncbi:hypothetical protein ABKV19_005491 [Rosa sericea]